MRQSIPSIFFITLDIINDIYYYVYDWLRVKDSSKGGATALYTEHRYGDPYVTSNFDVQFTQEPAVLTPDDP